MNVYIKSFFKSNLIFYNIWFIFNKNNLSKNIRLPSKTDNYFFDGYPRSGNTFINGLIKFLIPSIEGASHLHTIAPLKLALKLKLPTVIVIRKPLDAIISNIFRKTNDIKELSESDINEALIDYIKYYEYVLLNKEDIHMVNFIEFFDNSALHILKIFNYLKIEGFNEKKVNNIYEDFELKMKLKESNKTDEYSSLPNLKRMEFKAKIKPIILSHPNYKYAEEIYRKFQ